MQIEPPMSRLKMDSEFDRLSNLPSDVTEKILSLLSIKEAVRTSMLSSKWRYKWAMLPDLVFADVCFPGALYLHEKLVKVIDHVLFLHIGPIRKFKLSHRLLRNTTDIDRWILQLSRNSIKEFSFMFWKLPQYKIPSSLFSCQDLVHLVLTNCLLKPPHTFKGFKSLKTLKINGVTLTQDDIENLIVCCPALETLFMKDCFGFTKFKIDAPNLQVLVFRGAFEDLSLENSLKLQYIFLFGNRNQIRQVPGGFSNLVKIFVQCAHIKVVIMKYNFLKYLAVGEIPLKLPKPCMHLEDLHIEINFNDQKEVLTAVCLLRSAPALQRLNITVHQGGHGVVEEVNSSLEDHQNFLLGELRTVQAYGFTCTKAGLDFIRFLLSNSPKLEKVFVRPASPNHSSELLKRMIQFRCSSALAEIICLDPWHIT